MRLPFSSTTMLARGSREPASGLRSKRWLASALAACVLVLPAKTWAKELDQFTDRGWLLRYYGGGYRQVAGAPGPAQIDAIVDAEMNRLLGELERQLLALPAGDERARDAAVRRIFQHPLLPDLITPYEEWLGSEALVPLYRVRDKGVFGGAVDYDDVRMTWYIEPSAVLQIAGVLMGLDKPGHFLAQGFQYHEYYQGLPAHMSERHKLARVRRHGHATEVGRLGLATTGVYSFADLAANWQGFVFFRALFEDVMIEGTSRASYFRLDDSGSYRLSRAFHWSQWVSSDWDEALNPSLVQAPRFYRKIRQNFWRRSPAGNPSVCEQFWRDPAGFWGGREPIRPRAQYVSVPLADPQPRYEIDVVQICAAPAPGE